MQRRALLAALAATPLLGACGFRLRGSGMRAALPFSSVHIAGANNNAGLGYELRRMIEAGSGTEVLDTPKGAEAVVNILSEVRDRGTATLNTQGRVREYTLWYRVSFTATSQDGSTLLPPTEIALKRDLSYNESQAIAKEKEEEMLFRNMQSDAVQQILRRLAAIAPPAMSTPAPSTVESTAPQGQK